MEKRKLIEAIIFFIFIPLVLLIVVSLNDEMQFFYAISIIYPIYLGIVAGYYLFMRIFGYTELFKMLAASVVMNHLYTLVYYIEQQIKFDYLCKLNNQPPDLDGFIPFFLVLMINYMLFIIIAVLLVGIMIVLKLIDYKKNTRQIL